MKPSRSLAVAVGLLLSVLLNVLNAATTHVFIVDGYKGYTGTAGASSIIKGPYFMGQNYTVSNAITLFFDINNSTKTNRIISDNGSIYGTLYQRNIIKVSPANGVAITNVKIATVNDYSSGFVDNSGNRISRSGNIYEWKGSTTQPLKLRVTSDDANLNLGFTYIEVTYTNSSTEPSDPDPTKPGEPDPTKPGDPDPNNPDEPDPTKPGDPDKPKQIEPVEISPSSTFISPYQPITLSCGTEGVKIYYTTNGSIPDRNSTLYTKPFTLSISSGCTVRALAVSTDGQTSEASRRYFLNAVGSIPDLFTNGTTPEAVALTAPLQLVYREATTAYMLDISSANPTYLCVADANYYLNGINPGAIFSGIKCIAGSDGATPAAILSARPEVVTSAPLPDPTDTKISSITEAYLNRFVVIKNAIVTRRNTITQGASVMNLDDRFDIITNSLCDVEADVKAFVALDRSGYLVLRPISISPTSGSQPDNPANPGDGKTTCTLSALCLGDGKIEIFKSYNTYTLTPEGMPLTLPASVEKGSTVYLYFPPVEGISVASVVAGTSAIPGNSERFVNTVYGLMLPLNVDSDLTVIITFAGASGIGSILNDDDSATEAWFDMNGRRLPARPSSSGLYIHRTGSRITKVLIDQQPGF